MAEQWGSQLRDKLEDTEYKLAGIIAEEGVILEDEDGKLEFWAIRDDFAGYTIEVNGVGHEFVRTAGQYDLFCAGIEPEMEGEPFNSANVYHPY